MRRLMSLFVIMWLGLSLSSAQELPTVADLTLVEIISLEDFFAERFEATGNADYESSMYTSRTFSLSPDGQRAAWRAGARHARLCTTTFSDVAVTCLDASNIDSLSEVLRWSPDNRTIALTEEALTRGIDGDIWLWDTVENTLLNLTDDGIEGSVFTSETERALIDISPFFNPVNGDLYFLRFIDMTASEILRIRAQDGAIPLDAEPESITQVSGLLPSSVQSFEGFVSVSPDGEQLALILLEFDSSLNRLVLVDLTNNTDRLLTLQSAITAQGLPEDYDFGAFERGEEYMSGLTWQDSENLLVSFSNNGQPIVSESSFAPYQYLIDTDSGIATPLFQVDDEVHPEVVRQHQPNLIRDSNVMVYWKHQVDEATGTYGDAIAFYAYDWSTETTTLLTAKDDLRGIRINISIGDDGQTVRVFSGGFLLTFERNR